MAQLLPNIYQRFADLNNVPLAGGKLYSYNAGTNTPLATYSDQGASSPNTNPVILDSGGGANVWITNVGYKLVLQDSNGVVQWTVDNVYLVEPNAVGSGQLANGAVGTANLADGAVTTSKVQTAAITTALLASGAVTTGTIAAGAVTFACLDPSLDLSQLSTAIEVVIKRTNDFSGARLQAIPQFPWTNAVQQANPVTLPAGAGRSSKWSADGRFLAIASLNSPFLQIYERAGASFNLLPNPATLPPAAINDIAWSPNGDFVAVVHGGTPFLTIYQRQGINFTKISNPATLPATTGRSCKFSPNGEFLAVSSGSDVQIYNISGTTFTAIVSSGIASPNGINGFCMCWSADSQYLALTNGTGSGAFLSCYQRASTGFSLMSIATQPPTLPLSMVFTPDNQNLVIGHSTGPNYTSYYTVSGTNLNFASNPFPSGSPPAGPVNGIAVSPNGTLFAVVSSVAPYLQIYSGSFAAGWVLQTNPATIPVTGCTDVDWGPTNQWLALAVSSSPNMYTYISAGAISPKGLFYCRNFADV